MEAFAEVFELDAPEDACALEYQSIENWDSVGHMTLMSELEDRFDLVLEMDDIIEFSSYDKGIEILKKYGITLDDAD